MADIVSLLTENQWAYLCAMLDLVERRQMPSVTACCTAIGIDRTTAWRWHQQENFLKAKAKVMEGMIAARVPVVDFAIQQGALQGNAKSVEAYLRMTGRWNDGGPLELGMPSAGAPTSTTTNNGVQIGHVTFVGLPAPPTPQQAAALNPPMNANYVLQPAGTAK